MTQVRNFLKKHRVFLLGVILGLLFGYLLNGGDAQRVVEFLVSLALFGKGSTSICLAGLGLISGPLVKQKRSAAKLNQLSVDIADAVVYANVSRCRRIFLSQADGTTLETSAQQCAVVSARVLAIYEEVKYEALALLKAGYRGSDVANFLLKNLLPSLMKSLQGSHIVDVVMKMTKKR